MPRIIILRSRRRGIDRGIAIVQRVVRGRDTFDLTRDRRGGFTTLAALRDCRPLLGIEGPAEQGLDLIGKTFLVLFAVSRHRVLLLVCVKTGRSDMNVPATPWFPSRSLQFAPRCRDLRSEEHTSELQSLLRISYAVLCLKKTQTNTHQHTTAI